MELTTTEHVAIPIEAVWAEATNFAQFEAGLIKRGVALERKGDGDAGEGTAWEAVVPVSGRKLNAKAHIARMEAPNELRFEGSGTGIEGHVAARLTSLDANTTQIDMTIGLQAKAMGAQVILQPLRLAKKKLQKQLNTQMGRIARGMEERYAAARDAADQA
ncbi:MAG: SRPBCC family protein [Pseudomonadota bacterium]